VPLSTSFNDTFSQQVDNPFVDNAATAQHAQMMRTSWHNVDQLHLTVKNLCDRRFRAPTVIERLCVCSFYADTAAAQGLA
jgi:hypothetical protein